MASRDTIAAIATPVGRSAVGVVRVSGRDLATFVGELTGRSLEPRQATLVSFRNAAGEAIDRGLALYFPAPQSYTGEDVLELQGHGGQVVLRTLLGRCVDLGARIAEPGEFTRRAFLNGKLDLLQAEGVIDLIDASTAQAARSAMRSLQGEFSAAVDRLAAELVELRALVEATLDFPEEELDGADRLDAGKRLTRVRATLGEVIEAAHRGNLLRDGMRVVIAGAPNVGKSSLLNRLAGEDVAIVTEIPGTTRDAIRQVIDVAGMPVHIIDTAGLRESNDPVERIGIERTWVAIEDADCVLHVLDAERPEAAVEPSMLARLPSRASGVTVVNKIDLTAQAPFIRQTDAGIVVGVSAKTGDGLALLRQALMQVAGWDQREEGTFLARERHLRALGVAQHHLERAASAALPELLAEELRLAHEALAGLTGAFTADDLLGEIFQRFCIGK